MQAWITYYAKLIRKSFLKWVEYARSAIGPIREWDPSSIIRDAAIAGKTFESDAMSKLLDKQFKITDVRAINYAEQYAASEMRNISEVNRKLIQKVVSSSLRGEISVAEQKKIIRNMIGLSDNQMIWVQNFSKNSGLTGPALDKAVKRYVDKLIKQRAETIALTEAANATALGQKAAQEDLLMRGVISRETYGIEWVATPSERTCPICGALNGKTGQIGGTINGYTVPAHPRCRCRIVLVRL